MDTVLTLVAINALAATALALVAFLAGRLARLPAVAHALWLLVLLKLFAPPAIEIGVLPAIDPGERQRGSGTAPELSARGDPSFGGLLAELTPVAETGPVAATALRRPGRPLLAALVGIWLAGGIGLLALAVSRARRFRRLIGAARPLPPELRAETARLARGLGLRRPPTVRLVAARMSPMLWYRPGALELLLPEELMPRLGRAERDALLLHELAHVRRRDHWVRYLELGATCAFWWHPVVWWARRQLRRFEERACDAWVVRVQGGSRAYARALVATVEFLTGPRVATPAFASGAGDGRIMEERLTMILGTHKPRVTTAAHRAALALVAATALLVVPSWIERAPAAGPDLPAAAAETPATQERASEARERDLERRAAELERELQEVRERQAGDEHRRHERLAAEELDRARAEVEASSAGVAREARQALERAERLERQRVLERGEWARQLDYERALAEARRYDGTEREALEIELRELGDELRSLALRLQVLDERLRGMSRAPGPDDDGGALAR